MLLRLSLGNHTCCRVGDCCEQLTGKPTCVNKRWWPIFGYYSDECHKDSSQENQSSGRNSSLEMAKKKCMSVFISPTFHEDQPVDKSD